MSGSLIAMLWALAAFLGTLGLGLLVWFLWQSREHVGHVRQGLTAARSQDEGVSDIAEEQLVQQPGLLENFFRRLQFGGTKEDRLQLLQAGFRQSYALPLFLMIRLLLGFVLAILVELVVLFGVHHPPTIAYILWPIMALVVGILIPKFLLEARAKNRMEQVNAELPFFVDLLALLQCVGLSLEQSLLSVTAAGDAGLPTLAAEMREVGKQVAVGRPRIEAMQKLANILQDSDFRELTGLLKQIDKYGGEVATPLREFAERLQERRQMLARERAGKLNAKMIFVLVLTMLPGLVIITDGPAFTLIMQALHKL